MPGLLRSMMEGWSIADIADIVRDTTTQYGNPFPTGADNRSSAAPTPEFHSDATKQVKQFGTLDDVPDFALRSLEQLYPLLFARFEQHEGVIYYGPIALGLANPGYWGRQMLLPSNENLQVRFCPKTLLEADEVNVGMIATRVVNVLGQAQVALFVGFRSVAIGDDSVGRLELYPRVLGCKGLHVLMAGLFKRHNPRAGCDLSSGLAVAHDPFGYQALRSTSYSIFKKDRKNLSLSNDHHSANSVAPGCSLLTIAGEIVDVYLCPDRMRTAEPIAHSKWRESVEYMRASVLNEGGHEAGTAAISAAASIVELLSAEGFTSLRAHKFCEGALPDRLSGPNGPALGIAMAVRFALDYERYGLPRPSAADRAANDHLRMLLCTGQHGPLPFLDSGTFWCIDVVIRGAIATCSVELDALRKAKGLPSNCSINIGEDNKLWWQRVGQRLITSYFGLGSSTVVKQDGAKYGAPWRMHDPLTLARDKHLAANGCMLEGMDSPIIQLAQTGERRTALIKMLNDVEGWLRTGVVDDVRVNIENSQIAETDRLRQVKYLLIDLIKPSAVQQLAKQATSKGKIFMINGIVYDGATPFEDQVARHMVDEFNIQAMASAVNDAKDMLLHGSVTHFKYSCGAYIVAATQTAPCTDCEQPVHVLQGVMLNNSYGACTACHAKRCLQCAEAYAQAVQVTTSQYVGKRCHRCGADPAWVDVSKHTYANGEEVMTLNPQQRTPKIALPVSMSSVAAAQGSPVSPTPSTGGRSAKGKGKGKGR